MKISFYGFKFSFVYIAPYKNGIKITLERFDIAKKAVEVLAKKGIRAEAIQFRYYSVINIPNENIIAHLKFL